MDELDQPRDSARPFAELDRPRDSARPFAELDRPRDSAWPFAELDQSSSTNGRAGSNIIRLHLVLVAPIKLAIVSSRSEVLELGISPTALVAKILILLYSGLLRNLGFPIFPKSTEIESANFGSHIHHFEDCSSHTSFKQSVLFHIVRSRSPSPPLSGLGFFVLWRDFKYPLTEKVV
ncbi:hypothetical protein DY000_02033496 [Brassica cretica]|uniref:Uncharacterized protein n=1 Tax=Brassica cretica TaxID=69181 RepID=A0ABQ7DD10_BRACR|nr:hypothetical protein DY000_02033496 [Brassica cretica]